MGFDSFINLISTLADVAALIFAAAAVYIAWDTARATRQQAKLTKDALLQQQNTALADTVKHFSASYFELLSKYGNLEDNLESAEAYWAFYSTEFYFFQNNAIPEKLFALWMGDLADLYSQNQQIWKSHENYLKRYSIMYPKMEEFFEKLNSLAQKYSGDEFKQKRHESIFKFVVNWVEDKKNTSSNNILDN